MIEATKRQATRRKRTRESKRGFCRTCPARASCVAVCDELEALLCETCDTQVSVKTVAFNDLGVAPEDLPSDEDRRLKGGVA